MSPAPDRVVIAGAGLVGLAVGRRLAQEGREVVVLDKETEVAAHQSGHNSGVVHSGIYYTPGSLKAVLCRRGVTLLQEFCAEHGLEYREIGKVIVARDAVRARPARRPENRAHHNGVPRVRRLDRRRAARARAPGDRRRGAALPHDRDRRLSGGRSRHGRRHRGGRRPGPARRGRDRGQPTRRGRAWSRRAAATTAPTRWSSAPACSRTPWRWPPATTPPRRSCRSGASTSGSSPRRAGLVRGLVYPVPDPATRSSGVHFTPPRRRHRRHRAERRAGHRPRGLPAARRRSRRALADLALAGVPHAVPAALAAGVREMRGSVSKRAYVKPAPGATSPAAQRGRRARAGRGPRPGGRPGRLAGRRLPDQPARPGHRAAQRAVARPPPRRWRSPSTSSARSAPQAELGQPTTITWRMRGPWTPSTRSSSMSLVALGPLTQVSGRERPARRTRRGRRRRPGPPRRCRRGGRARA